MSPSNEFHWKGSISNPELTAGYSLLTPVLPSYSHPSAASIQGSPLLCASGPGMSSWPLENRTVFCVFLGHIQKGFSPFSHHELSSGDTDLLQFLKNERGLICLHLHLLQGQPSGSDVLFPFTQQHIQMQFKKWSKRNFQEPVFCLKMRYDSETFFTFYAQVITLKLLPEHLCLGQSTTIL
ncbi:unnamed protein product [Rangifer tarandus platyrhynchus]|uniref:Uncharacterized protein n=2 Tax=Rangifer tarandus platyrhynchus TaxID=3082113 RepID=A0ABN8ZS76_RANTA|nr:unnamed protein product [Rangifer tarandus platyrhynchus]